MSVAALEPSSVADDKVDWGARFSRIAVYGVLIFAALVFLVPLMSMVFTSLKDMDEIRGKSAGATG